MGDMGYSALGVKHQAAPVVVRINDTVDADEMLGIGAAETYDASELFTGGVGILKYAAEPSGTNKAALTATNEDDGRMLTITIKSGAHYMAADAESDPMDSGRMEITVTATDEADVQVSTTIHVVRNKAPVVPDNATEIPPLLIGTQMAKSLGETPEWPGGDAYVCEMMNSCVLTLLHNAVSGNHFEDEDGTLMYSAVSEDTSKVQVSTNADGKLVFTGVASTEKDDGMNDFATEGVTITVTATDMGDLTSDEVIFKVLVNAQPARTDVAIPAVTLDDEPRTIDVSHFVTDHEDITYTVMDNEANAYVTVTNDEGTRGAEVLLTPTLNGLNGSREVKIRAAEPSGTPIREDGIVGQYVDFSIMVTNAAN
jgi:hypothetical protein